MKVLNRLSGQLLLSGLFLLVLFATADAATQITSLPFTCSYTDTFIIAGNLQSGSGNALTIAANNVIINGNNKTITYAVSGAGIGIRYSGSRSGLEVFNLTLTEGNGGGNAIVQNQDSFNGMKIHHCTINCNTSAAFAFRFTNFIAGQTGIAIYNCTINCNPTSGTYAHALAFEGSGNPALSGSIHDNTITIGGTLSSSRPTNIFLSNTNGVMDIYNNNLYMNGPDDNNAVRFWASNNNKVHGNNIYMNCDHCRGINVDGGSEGNQVYENIVDANTTSANGSSSCIRVRFGSDDNSFWSNTIDTRDAIDCFGIRHGERQSSTPTDSPKRNRYYYNNLTGHQQLVRIENASDSTVFFGNTYTVTDGGPCVYLLSTGTGQQIDSLYFEHETFNTSGITKVYFSTYAGTSQYSNIVFCACGITAANVYDDGATGFVIRNEPCRIVVKFPDKVQGVKILP